MNDPDDVKTANAVRCRICGANADLLNAGIYVCQKNPAHQGNTFVGIFLDLSYPKRQGETKMAEQDKHNLADVSKHTPGKWFIEKRLLGSGWHFRLGQAPFKDIVEAEANARLIAAAPDLLKACEKASYMNCHILTRDKPDWLKQIEAALELAKKGA